MARIESRFLILGLFLCMAAFGQAPPRTPDGKLVGDVADRAANAPISAAFLLVHRPDGKKDVIVKVSDGHFHLALSPSLYDVFVAAPGFGPSCRKIRISGAQTVTFKPRLEPDATP